MAPRDIHRPRGRVRGRMASARPGAPSLLALLCAGCVTSAPSFEPPDHPERSNAADTLYWLLAGRFDSADQARSTPGYPALQVVACPAEVVGLGPRALYVEQARMESPRAPYEQRVYVLEPLEPSSSVAVSHVFVLAQPAAAVGACEQGRPPRFERDALVEHLGCAVRLHAEGNAWQGSTSGQGCRSALGGASYVTGEWMVDARGFRSWERGFDATGAQTWGVDSTPYVFVRRTPLP
ncbi:MAG TPA: chromophore lyase CpcT/CpeT [Myxococcaceae bacterium]|nr:chromophore lyase CpcT/CpeT [Myxococcaceae bacterium]